MLQALQNFSNLVGHRAVDLVENQLGIAQDGVQRGAQFVAHVGQKFGFVLVGPCQFTALGFDFAEQAGIVDRDHGLGRKGLEQLDHR